LPNAELTGVTHHNTPIDIKQSKFVPEIVTASVTIQVVRFTVHSSEVIAQ
jgi:hypothetical protein